MTTAIFKRPEVVEVEKLVAAVYIDRYGDQGWERRAPLVRAGLVMCVMDAARDGVAQCLAHTERNGVEHFVDGDLVRAALGTATPARPTVPTAQEAH